MDLTKDTDGAPVIYCEKSGLVGRMWLMMQKENYTVELITYHCIINEEMLYSEVLKRYQDLSHHQFQSFLSRKLDS